MTPTQSRAAKPQIFWLCCLLPLVLCGQFSFGEDEQSLKDNATRYMNDYLVDMETIANRAYLYSGDTTQIQSQAEFSGTFPYMGFIASKSRETDRETLSRFWFISSRTTVPSMMSGYGYDEVLVGTERWFSLAGGTTKKYIPVKDQEHKYESTKLDPRVAVLCTAGALELGLSFSRESYGYVTTLKLVKAVVCPFGLRAVYEAKTGWVHIVYDERKGFRPTLLAVTIAGVDIDKDVSNASLVNRARWEKNAEGTWMPIAGYNIDYKGMSAASHTKFKRFSYKCLWLEPHEVPENAFDIEAISSVPGVRFAEAEGWIKRLSKIPDVDEPKK